MDEPTVFVVDDDQTNRDLLVRLMESVDLAVESFSSAREFLDAFHPDRRGCLLLDVRMPGMSGPEKNAAAMIAVSERRAVNPNGG